MSKELWKELKENCGDYFIHLHKEFPQFNLTIADYRKIGNILEEQGKNIEKVKIITYVFDKIEDYPRTFVDNWKENKEDTLNLITHLSKDSKQIRNNLYIYVGDSNTLIEWDKGKNNNKKYKEGIKDRILGKLEGFDSIKELDKLTNEDLEELETYINNVEFKVKQIQIYKDTKDFIEDSYDDYDSLENLMWNLVSIIENQGNLEDTLTSKLKMKELLSGKIIIFEI